MRLDLAMGLKVGDKVYNAFMDELVITSRFDTPMNDSKKIHNIILSTIDTRLNRNTYSFDDIYLKNLEGESDEEISFVNWAKDNRDYLGDTDEWFSVMKNCYKQGFSMGFEHKRRTSYEEQMQK
jgi:hypothetical protein